MSVSQPPSETLGATAKPAHKLWRVGTLVYTTPALVGLFFWLLGGDFGFYLKERSVPYVLQVLLKSHGASDALVGFFLITLPYALTVVIVPIVGYISDNHRSRWGRRIPFLLAPTPFLFVAMVGMAFSPQLGNKMHLLLGPYSPGLDASILLSLAVTWTIFEICTIVCQSVLVALIADVVPIEVIGRFFGLFRMVSLVSGILFNYYWFAYIESHFALLLIGIGVVYTVSFTAMCLKVKEGAPPPESGKPIVADPRRLFKVFFSAKQYFRICLRNRYYTWVFLSLTLSYMSAVPIGLFSLYYAQQMGMNLDSLGKYFALQLVVSLFHAYPTGWLADRFHPLRLTVISLASVAISTAAAFFLVHDELTFGISVVICGTLAGFWSTAIAPLPAVLFPKEHFATFDSARQMFIALGLMVMGPVSGLILDALGNDYRYMYLVASIPAFLGLLITLVVYRRFVSIGGPKAYIAP